MSLFVKRRVPSLADVSDEALRQLSKLLYIDTTDYFGDRVGEWLAEQEQQVKWLDATLLHSRDLFTRFALSMRKRNFPLYSEGLRLCPAHMALDPRVIRNMLQLVADECTIQTNRYRSLRLKKKLSPSLEGWMERIDSVTALWLGDDNFRRVFGCRLRGRMPDCVKTKCEACILAVIGGSAVHLTDLRSSVLARQAYDTKLTGRECRTPRLLRIISSWISFFQADCRKAICECSEAIVGDIVKMRILARERRNKEDERRRRKGKPPRLRSNARVRLTKEGLPIPRQPRLRKGDRERLIRTVERRMETVLSLQETVVEQQEQELETFRRPVSDEAHDSMRIGSSNPFTRKINDTTETITGSKPDKEKQINSWENWLMDEDTCEKQAGKEEYWEREYRQHTLDDGSSCENICGHSKLGFGANTGQPMNDTTSSWTSKVDDESPLITQMPLLYCGNKISSLEEAAVSSVYSCDEQVNTKIKSIEETFALMSGFTRDSVTPASLRGMNEKLDDIKTERNTNRKTALAMLEGRADEEDAASCYETMGWGGPSRR